tara:strand:+ start:113 stop:484 length:372 start_codon:yes stop_codon:yes gene_type:complete
MRNYKALKAAGKASVQKATVVDIPVVKAVAEVKYKDGDDIPDGKEIGDVKVKKVKGRAGMSHEALQVAIKRYDPNTGESLDDSVRTYELSEVKREIDSCKSRITKLEAEQADWEQLETDLKAL